MSDIKKWVGRYEIDISSIANVLTYIYNVCMHTSSYIYIGKCNLAYAWILKRYASYFKQGNSFL